MISNFPAVSIWYFVGYAHAGCGWGICDGTMNPKLHLIVESLLLLLILLTPCAAARVQRPDFVAVENGMLRANGRAHRFVGTNYWYGSLLGLEKNKKRGVERLRKELHFLQKNGVTNLRLMAGAEGSGRLNGVMRVGPPLQPEEGTFDEGMLDGLDLILAEMGKRRMRAVIFFSNNWEWSGGWQQYLIWNGRASAELLTRKPGWDELRDVVSKFYSCEPCKASYLKQGRFVMGRTNKITGRRYVDDPTIMAWELANEPRPMRSGANRLYAEWIREVAAEIKARDKNHLVTIGHEGSIGTEGMELFEEVHTDANIDYLTIHIWAKNWGWYSGTNYAEAFPKAVQYIEDHIRVARRLNKPLVIEEFGLPRDPAKTNSPPRRRDAAVFTSGLSLDPGSSTSIRDEYFRKIFAYVGKGPVAGANFWAFGGTARPVKGQVYWKAEDDWMGDPPMEEQGLNTVFDVDRSTWNVIRSAGRSIRNKN